MIENIFFIIIFLCVLYSVALGADERAYVPRDIPGSAAGGGYFGELITHPGVSVFGELVFNHSENQILNRISFIYYLHPYQSHNFIFLPELVYRRWTSRLRFFEFALGAGVQHQSPASIVYTPTDDGFEETGGGYFYFAPSIGLRYGRSFRLKKGS
jgi:hypothetical protein